VVGGAFREPVHAIPAGVVAVEQDRLRVPTVTFDGARRAVVAGDGDDGGLGGHQQAEGGIGFFNGGDFAGKVAIFTVHVGAFDVDEDVIKRLEGVRGGGEFFFYCLRAFDFLHADELGETFVHRVDGDGGGFEAVAFLEGFDFWLVRDAAEQKAIGRLAVFQQRQRLLVKLGDDFGGFGGFGGLLDRLDGRNGETFAMRVGVGERTFQTFAAKQHNETVAFAGFDDDLGVTDLFDFLLQDFHLRFTHFGVNAAGAAVGDDPFGGERAEIGASSDVAGLEIQTETERLDHATTDFKFERVVTEEAEMAGATARRDTGGDGRHATKRGVFGEGVEVGRFGGFERCFETVFFDSDVAEAVQNDESEFGGVGDQQAFIELIEFHKWLISP